MTNGHPANIHDRVTGHWVTGPCATAHMRGWLELRLPVLLEERIDSFVSPLVSHEDAIDEVGLFSEPKTLC